MQRTTLCILVKEKERKLDAVLLAMKKRGFGQGWWNGYGGKLEKGESIVQAAFRETKEEGGIEIDLESMEKVAEVNFRFPHRPDWDQVMHVYFVKLWIGEPEESEEMKPSWFKMDEIPYDKMWPGDNKWMPLIFQGQKVKGQIAFGENHKLIDYNVNPIDDL